VADVMDRHPLRVDEAVPVHQVSQLATSRPHETVQDPVLVERGGRYAGIVTTQALLSTVTELEIRHATYASPLTGLPGNVVIEGEIRRALDHATDAAPGVIVYVDIDNFKAFNDVYGFAAGDDVIRLVAEVLQEVFVHPTEDVFVGHVGGDDFVLVVPGDGRVEERCEQVGAMFDARVRRFYGPSDLARGGIVTCDRRGVESFFPIATLSVAIVSAFHSPGGEVHEVARVAAELKRHAKTLARETPAPSSRVVRDRRASSSGMLAAKRSGP
jgi:GGDEF domain-containing protein